MASEEMKYVRKVASEQGEQIAKQAMAEMTQNRAPGQANGSRGGFAPVQANPLNPHAKTTFQKTPEGSEKLPRQS